MRAGAPECANDGWIVTSAAVVDCTVRVGVEEDESDVGHKVPIVTTATTVAAATATIAMGYEPLGGLLLSGRRVERWTRRLK